jgi:uncharacterized protein (TIGR02284 family)
VNPAQRPFETVGRGAGFSRFLLLAAGGGESRTAGGPCPSRISQVFLFIYKIEVSMATDAGRQHEMQLALDKLISTLLDSQKGFADIGEHLKDETLKRYFLAESLKRASFRGELEEILHQNGVHDIKESSTAIGTLQRTWGDVKARLGGGDHTLLDTAEQGEDEAKKAYADVLDQDLPLPVRQLIAEQQAHILTSHDFVRSHRDALAAN